ncbi:MAG: serine/threonine protein kinase [Eubacterium sp.]|nr:serine/threonine protein kinase [Eubacterium sp.]
MYQIIKEIGSDTLLAEKDSIKYVLKRIDFGDIEIIKALMNLNNTNIVGFIELITIGEKFYCVEEYIDGITLDEYIKQNGALSDERAMSIVYEICLGLSDIHKLGIVHRDINPSNIMLDKFGRVKIIDFGISRTNKADKSKDTRILGTQGYAAPEQYGFSQTNAKSDIYSLGILINYIKTASLPDEVIADGLLGEIAQKCTRIDDSQRYESVDEIITALKTGRANGNKGKYVLPGFRSGKTLNMIISSIYYIFTVIVFLGYLIDPIDHSTDIYFSMFVLFLLIVPVFIFFNYLGWADNFQITKKHSKRFTCILYGTLYEILTFFIFIIIYQPK